MVMVCKHESYENVYSIQMKSTEWINIHENINGVIHVTRKKSQNSYKSRKDKIAKAIVNKKNKTGGISVSDFKTYYRAVVYKIPW